MKRVLTIIVMAFAIVEPVFSQDFDKKNLLYRVNPSGNNTVELLGFEKKPKEELIIPEEVSYKGTKYVVSTVSEGAFKDCEVLTKVVGVTIKEVKDGAFEGCKNLASVVFTNQLNNIGKKAFHGCASLQEVIMGDNIQVIDDAAFAGCSALHELALGNSLKSIGTGIINEAGISSITLPGLLINVGTGAFADCKSLSSVTFSEGVKEIGTRAFAGTSITSISFPKSLESVGNSAFADCKSLSSVTFSEGVKEIGTRAFVGTSITSISFPKSLESVGNSAFADCINLKTLSLNNGLKNIGSGAFARIGVEYLAIPNTIKEVQERTFADCESLRSITLGDEIEEIKDLAFVNCSQLSVDFSDVPCNISENAFSGCKEVIMGDHSLKRISKMLKDNFKLEENRFENGLIMVSKNGKYGFINKMGQLIIPCIYDSAGRWDSCITVSLDDKSGLYSLDGTTRTSCKYLAFRDFSDGVYMAFSINDKYGFVDINGKEILPCEYGVAKPFIDGVCWCEKQGTWYAVDKKGNLIAKVPNASVEEYKDGIATALISGSKWIIIDKLGHLYDVPDNNEPTLFHYGLIRVKNNDGLFGLIDKNLNVILPAEYKDIYDFHPGGGASVIRKKVGTKMAKSVMGDMRLSDDIKEGAIDSTGKVVIPCIYERVQVYYGLVRITNNKKVWYANTDGVAIDADFVDPSIGFKYGIAVAKKEEKYGCIDRTGKLVVPYIYDYIDNKPSEGLLIVKKDNKYGYVDTMGNLVVPTEWSYTEGFHEGLAKVKNGMKTHFIDKSGRVIISLDYDDVGDFYDGMAYVMKDGKLGYIDKTGKLTVPCVYKGKFVHKGDATEAIGTEVVEVAFDDYINERDENNYVSIENFNEGLVFVHKGDKVGFVDKKGKSTFDF